MNARYRLQEDPAESCDVLAKLIVNCSDPDLRMLMVKDFATKVKDLEIEHQKDLVQFFFTLKLRVEELLSIRNLNLFKHDVLVSYMSADIAWAKWITYTLEERGYSCVQKSIDSEEHHNLLLDIQRMTAEFESMLIVLTPAYFASDFRASLWNTVLALDPIGSKRLLLPVRVHDEASDSFIPQITSIDLFDIDEEQASMKLLADLPQTDNILPVSRTLSHKHEEAVEHTFADPPPFPGKRRTEGILSKKELLPTERVLPAKDVGLSDMPLNGEQIRQLQHALLSAFPDFASLKMFVRTRLNENLETIVGRGSLSENVFDLITWAIPRGRAAELVEKARQQNSGDLALRDFAGQFFGRTQ